MSQKAFYKPTNSLTVILSCNEGLEIKLNQSKKNIYFTKEHLLQFLIFIQMENIKSV